MPVGTPMALAPVYLNTYGISMSAGRECEGDRQRNAPRFRYRQSILLLRRDLGIARSASSAAAETGAGPNIVIRW